MLVRLQMALDVVWAKLRVKSGVEGLALNSRVLRRSEVLAHAHSYPESIPGWLCRCLGLIFR